MLKLRMYQFSQNRENYKQMLIFHFPIIIRNFSQFAIGPNIGPNIDHWPQHGQATDWMIWTRIKMIEVQKLEIVTFWAPIILILAQIIRSSGWAVLGRIWAHIAPHPIIDCGAVAVNITWFVVFEFVHAFIIFPQSFIVMFCWISQLFIMCNVSVGSKCFCYCWLNQFQQL